MQPPRRKLYSCCNTPSCRPRRFDRLHPRPSCEPSRALRAPRAYRGPSRSSGRSSRSPPCLLVRASSWRNVFSAGAGGSRPSHEAMYKHAVKTILARCAKQCVKVLQVRVTPPSEHKPTCDSVGPRRPICIAFTIADSLEFARSNKRVNARNAVSTMRPRLSLSPSAFRQAHKVVRSLDQRVALLAQQLVVSSYKPAQWHCWRFRRDNPIRQGWSVPEDA